MRKKIPSREYKKVIYKDEFNLREFIKGIIINNNMLHTCGLVLPRKAVLYSS